MILDHVHFDSNLLTDGRVTRALQKFREGKSPGNDERGNKPNPRAILAADTEFVKHHIESFPEHESHYTGVHNTYKKYLNENLDVSKTYNLYNEYCLLKDVINSRLKLPMLVYIKKKKNWQKVKEGSRPGFHHGTIDLYTTTGSRAVMPRTWLVSVLGQASSPSTYRVNPKSRNISINCV
jgi:hypothetical protein